MYRYAKSILRYATIFLLIGLQIAIMIALAVLLKKNALFIYLLIEVLGVLVCIPIIQQQIDSAYKIFWIIVILALPIVGHLMYEVWGSETWLKRENLRIHTQIERSRNTIIEQGIHEKLFPDNITTQSTNSGVNKIISYLQNLGFRGYGNNALNYFDSGENVFDDIRNSLLKAEKFIFISFFTIADGIIWNGILDVLMQKSENGVQVKVLYDDAGSFMTLSDATLDKMRKSRIEILRFNALERSFHKLFQSHRSHQKMIIIDGNVAYTGGVSASDRYANLKSPFGHWKDAAIRMDGDGAIGLLAIFMGMWRAAGGSGEETHFAPKNMPTTGKQFCIPFMDGPANNPENPARATYRLIISTADKEVNIMTPYLILDDTIRDELLLAARAGTQIHIITPGIFDKRMNRYLTRQQFGVLLKAGIHIYEYTPGFVHAKICMNENSGVVGTINMSYRSFHLHYECAVYTPDQIFLEEMRQDFRKTLEKCTKITYDDWKGRPFREKIMESVAVLLKSQY